MSVSFDKVQEKAPALLNLAKLSRVELSKKNLDGVKARVAFVLDHSGSMGGRYKSGAMQRLAEKILAVATGFDDDGDIDLFVFDSKADFLGEVNLDNYRGAVDRLRGKRHLGTTSYDGAFYAVQEHYGLKPVEQISGVKSLFGKGKKFEPAISSAELPVFAVFLTDGAPDSRPKAVKALTEVSHSPIFWKFLSVGGEDMEFLQKLDDLDDRYIDNADYQNLGADVDALSDKQLFDYLLVEFNDWIVEAKNKGLLTS